MNIKQILITAAITLAVSENSALALNRDKACPNGICPNIGMGFYLPDINVNKELRGGKVLLKSHPKLDECVQVRESYAANGGFKDSNSMTELVSNISSSISGTADAKTKAYSVSTSVSAETGLDSNTKSAFHSTIYDKSLTQGLAELVQSEDCFGLSVLSDDFINHFKALPLPDSNPNDSVWDDYRMFFSSFGSHYLSSLDYGSRFQIWQSSTSASSDISTNLKAKACAKVEGTTPIAQGGASGCAAYNEATRKKALTEETREDQFIRGGTESARKALLNLVSVKTMADFIDTAPASEEPIAWTFTPIWETLQNQYRLRCEEGKNKAECDNYQRAMNLQAVYEGRGAWECETRYSGNGDNNGRNILLGGLRKAPRDKSDKTGVAGWECRQAKIGCNTDDDCHYIVGKIVANCYGPTCFEHRIIPGTNKWLTVVRADRDPTKTKDQGSNNSCYVKGGKGLCQKDWQGGENERERTIWSQGFSSRGTYAAASATVSASDANSDQEDVADDGYSVEVSISNNHDLFEELAEKRAAEGSDTAQTEPDANQTNDSVIGYQVLSNPPGINCPGAACSANFNRGEKVTIVWLDNDPKIKFIKWDDDRCSDKTHKVSIDKALAMLGTAAEALRVDDAKEANICQFTLTESVQIDAEVKETIKRH